MNTKTVSIIILNWNGWKDTLECLESLSKIKYRHFNTIIVDNGSEDNSVKEINNYLRSETTQFPGTDPLILNYQNTVPPLDPKIPIPRFVIIQTGKNYGYTRGNNIGIEFACKQFKPDYVLLLNNDTIVDPEFLGELINVGDSNQKIGFVGPKIYFHNNGDESRKIQYVGGRQNMWRFEPQPIGYGEEDMGQYDENQMVDYVSGACILAKTSMLTDIGLLDDEFFSYREENDWCKTGYEHGWQTYLAYRARIWHKAQGSTKKKVQQPFILYYMTKNRFLFMKKHGSVAQLITFLLFFFLFDFWYRILASLLYHQQPELVKCFLKAVADGVKYF
jgi:GT2 family glycosyltransferase